MVISKWIHYKKAAGLAASALLLSLSLLPGMPAEAREGLHQSYELQKVVIFSRHNLRSPMATDSEKRKSLTPHRWQDYKGAPGDLSNRGGLVETMMGQSVKNELDKEKFMVSPKDWEGKDVYFYADSDQRTIATAHYFAAGVAPEANIRVHHKPEGTKDAAFSTSLPASLGEDTLSAIQKGEKIWADSFISAKKEEMAGDFQELSRVLDIPSSPAARKGDFKGFVPEDLHITMKSGKKPKMTGSLKTAHSLADSLLIRYYETEDDSQAAFGHTMTFGDWEKIGRIKDDFGILLYGEPEAAHYMALPLVRMMDGEMENRRKFSFICGHDSNMTAILAALGTRPYELPESIEKKVPFGVKLMIEKWKGTDGILYGSVSLLYPSSRDIRRLTVPKEGESPLQYPLTFHGILKNEDGMMKWEDLERLFRQ